MNKIDSNKKTTTRRALGRGLRALISTPSVAVDPTSSKNNAGVNEPIQAFAANTALALSEQARDGAVYLAIDKIQGNPDQPRQIFNQIELEELASSIKALGVIQPILVRPIKNSDKFQVIAGERRWRAAKLAQLAQLPVIIRTIDDRLALETALVENIQRSSLSPTEEARAYQSLIDDFGLGQKEVSERVGKDRTSVTNFIRLLKLPNEVLDLLDSGQISMGHAKAILSAREPAVQKNLANKCVNERLSVREIEEITARTVVLNVKKPGKKQAASKSDFPDIADRLRTTLGTKVIIKHDKKKKRGKILIDYYSEEELDRLVDALT